MSDYPTTRLEVLLVAYFHIDGLGSRLREIQFVRATGIIY